MDAARLRQSLPGVALTYLPRIGSTNDEARRLAAEGAPDGAAVLADEQTAGRGRRGARWVSPPARNLMVSVLRRPISPSSASPTAKPGPDTTAEISLLSSPSSTAAKPAPLHLPPEHWTRLTLAAALAVCDTLDSSPGLSARAEVKWPNDVYLSNRKVAGILVESAMDGGGGGHVIIGTGLNLNLQPADFPEDLRDIATSVWMENGGLDVDRTAAAITFLQALERRCLQTVSDFPAMLHEAWSRSWLAGKTITLQSSGHELEGIAHGLGPEGELLLREESGTIRPIASADLVRVTSRNIR